MNQTNLQRLLSVGFVTSRSNLAAKRPSWTSCASQKTTKTWASSCNGRVGVGVSSLFILVCSGRTVRCVYFPYRFKRGLLSQSNWFEQAFLLSMCLDDDCTYIATVHLPLRPMYEIFWNTGGHHSFEDMHEPMLSTYGQLRQQPNIVLVAGSGLGDAVHSM